MANRNEHLVVVMVEPAPKSEFEIWPLHITIVPWFPCDDENRLDETLQKITAQHKPFVVKAGKIERWGKKEKYDVQVIEDKGELHKLHLDVFHSLESSGFPIHQKDFLGDKFTPHMALRNRYSRGKALKVGTQLPIKYFTLFKQFRLKGSGTMIKSQAKKYELGS